MGALVVVQLAILTIAILFSAWRICEQLADLSRLMNDERDERIIRERQGASTQKDTKDG